MGLAETEAAQSAHEFGAEVDMNPNPTKAKYVQGSIGYSLDELIELNALPSPNHIKIDVDGIEHLVVKGARDTLASPELNQS